MLYFWFIFLPLFEPAQTRQIIWGNLGNSYSQLFCVLRFLIRRIRKNLKIWAVNPKSVNTNKETHTQIGAINWIHRKQNNTKIRFFHVPRHKKDIRNCVVIVRLRNDLLSYSSFAHHPERMYSIQTIWFESGLEGDALPYSKSNNIRTFHILKWIRMAIFRLKNDCLGKIGRIWFKCTIFKDLPRASNLGKEDCLFQYLKRLGSLG